MILEGGGWAFNPFVNQLKSKMEESPVFHDTHPLTIHHPYQPITTITKPLVTVKDYLESLPEWITKLALANVVNEINLEYNVNSLHDAVELAFYWDETNEDVTFWESVANSNKDTVFEMEVDFIDGPLKGRHRVKIIPYVYIDDYIYEKSECKGVISYYYLQLK